MTPITRADQYFVGLAEVLHRMDTDGVDHISQILLRAWEERRRVFLFGNGGSASLASHFACDLGKGTIARQDHTKRFRVVALTDNIPLITAWANDASYEDIFAQQLRNLLEPRDIVLAISASGNSRNVLNALQYAKAAGGYCIGLTGFEGGKMKPLCDLCLVVPSDNMQLIEDVHLSIAHALFTLIRHELEKRPCLKDVKVAVGAC